MSGCGRIRAAAHISLSIQQAMAETLASCSAADISAVLLKSLMGACSAGSERLMLPMIDMVPVGFLTARSNGPGPSGFLGAAGAGSSAGETTESLRST